MLAVVAERWDTDRGGRERYAADLIAYLQAAGRHVTRAEPDRLVRHHQGRILALTPMTGATHYQLHGGLLASAFEGERESMQSVVRRALFSPALKFNRRRQRLMDDEKLVLEGPTELMVFSDATARQLVNRGVSRSRIRVSRPGVHLQRFHSDTADATHRAEPSVHLVFAGHNFALKGLQAAIQTVARIRRGGLDASLTVAGGGPIRTFRRIAEREGVGGHVRFAGTVSQDEVADLYRSSDALIHPTFYDPFPRVVVEALACGCPVITTARCGAAEILTDGRQGFVVSDPRDVGGLADAVGQVVHSTTRAGLRRAAAELGQSFDDLCHFRAAAGWIFGEDT